MDLLSWKSFWVIIFNASDVFTSWSRVQGTIITCDYLIMPFLIKSMQIKHFITELIWYHTVQIQHIIVIIVPLLWYSSYNYDILNVKLNQFWNAWLVQLVRYKRSHVFVLLVYFKIKTTFNNTPYSIKWFHFTNLDIVRTCSLQFNAFP